MIPESGVSAKNLSKCTFLITCSKWPSILKFLPQFWYFFPILLVNCRRIRFIFELHFAKWYTLKMQLFKSCSKYRPMLNNSSKITQISLHFWDLIAILRTIWKQPLFFLCCSRKILKEIRFVGACSITESNRLPQESLRAFLYEERLGYIATCKCLFTGIMLQ